MFTMHKRTIVMVVSVFLVGGCGFDAASNKACFDASRAQAEAMRGANDVRPNNTTESVAWLDVISAATEWKKKACSNTKGEFNDQVQKYRQFEAQQLRQLEAK